jgi:hypothetical protein
MNAFFGGIQGIALLRRGAFGNHFVSYACRRGWIQSKSKQMSWR